MGNAIFLLLMTAASMAGGQAFNLVTELFAKNAVLQDGTGTIPLDPARAVPASPAGTQPPGAREAPVMAILASAPATDAVTSHPTLVPGPIAARPEAITATPGPAPTAQPPTAQPPAAMPTAAAPADATTPAAPVPAIPSTTLLALARDTPTRLPDGSVFLPIAVQHLVGLRTEITKVEQLSGAVQIAGRVVTSRDVGALIQSTQTGVIEAADTTVPRIGTRVTKGQLLAYQRPILDAARSAELHAKMAEIEGLIEMGEQRVARLREVMFIRYRQSKIDAVLAEVANYRRQLQIYRALLSERVEIRAHTSGVISRVNFVTGQIVEPQTTLFEIVDPTRLWVEAAAYDPALAQDVGEAQAITGDGQVLALRFTGGGLTLQNQAVPLQFEIVGPAAGVQIGKPVTVIVKRRNDRVAGIRLPSAAIVHSASGENVVWQRLSAEAFISRPVTAAPLDGENVMITSGLTANMRIVTADSAMLAQVR